LINGPINRSLGVKKIHGSNLAYGLQLDTA
jgi:hypothetical protein